jgi:hypothetical protein
MKALVKYKKGIGNMKIKYVPIPEPEILKLIRVTKRCRKLQKKLE